MPTVFDITLPLDDATPLFPGDPAPCFPQSCRLEKGDPVTTSEIHMSCHAGTHVDLPGHFIAGGKCLADYEVSDFMGPAQVLDLTSISRSIDASDLGSMQIPENQHLLLKTRGGALLSQPTFNPDYTHLTPNAVHHLLAAKPRSIGIDYYSLDPAESTHFPAHRLCAEAGLPVFVCLDLRKVSAGPYQFAGLPLHAPSLEGAPIRAILWAE